jgi:hypothetical protein
LEAVDLAVELHVGEDRLDHALTFSIEPAALLVARTRRIQL